MTFNLFKNYVFLFSLISSMNAQALTAPVQTLATMETKANAVAVRSDVGVPMPHYEIPLRLLTENKAFNLDPSLYSSLVFTKNGELYVRWVVNPEDTKWFKDVEAFMTENGLKPVRKFYFTGYQTASRSYLVEDPTGKVQFSIKTSTDKTGGNWTDKKQYFQDAFDIRAVSDLIARAQMAQPFKNMVIMHEPLVFGIEGVDQSIVVRELGNLPKNSEYTYIPGFSVLHEEIGKEIAAKNGSNDPYDFWTKNYVVPMARAAAEMVARTGIWFDSPHGQNFLVELDKNGKPTGKMVLRDLGDVYLNKDFMAALGEERIVKQFSEASNIIDSLSVAFGPLHGNKPPSWISNEQYNKWGQIYEAVVKAQLAVNTGIPQSAMKMTSRKSAFSYFSVGTESNTPEWKNYFSNKLRQPVRFCRQLY